MDREVKKDCNLEFGNDASKKCMVDSSKEEIKRPETGSTKRAGSHSDSAADHSAKIRERNERVKQWLWRYREAKKDIRRLEEELRELMESQESASAIGYSDMPKGSLDQSDLSDYLVEREKVWKKIQKARYRNAMIMNEIKNVIERLDTADEKYILSNRYLIGKSWEDICSECRYSWRQMHRIHCKSLGKIYDFIKNGIV